MFERVAATVELIFFMQSGQEVIYSILLCVILNG